MHPTILPSPQPQTAPPALDINIAQHIGAALGAQRLTVPAGTILCAPEQALTTVYALIQGQLTVRTRAGQRLPVEDTPLIVGALEVWTGQDWGLTVQAVTPCAVVALDASSFRQWLRINASLRQVAGQLVTDLMRRVQMAGVLTRAFATLPDGLLELVIRQAHWRQLAREAVLLRQGETTSSLFLVISGRLQRVYQGADETAHLIGQVAEAEWAGSLLDSSPQPASVIAARTTMLLELPLSLCQQLWQRFPHTLLPLWQQVARQPATMLQALDARPRPPTTLALIPASGEVEMAHFAAQLARAMAPPGAVRIVTRQSIDEQYGQKRAADIPPHHPLHPLLDDWLNSSERAAQYTLYVADPAWSEWTRRCLRQADHYLIVAAAQRDPTPTVVEQAIYAQRTATPPDLVLLHSPDVEQPHGTAAWLDQRPIRTHYHVRQDDPAHYASLARRLTGQAVALVLSGGGARGFAHLGLLRLLEERGMSWDLIGGSSMGALLAIPFVLGWCFADTMHLAAQFGNPKALFDYTLPLVALFASNKVTDMIRANVGDLQIEDLWRPYFAIATDLTAGQMITYTRGPLWRAVRASLSIPVIFAPLIDERGHLLVDGGVMNNFPVDVMRSQVGSGTIIGVDVGHRPEEQTAYDYETGISGWQVLRSRLTPGRESLDAPSLASILVRTMMINNRQVARRAQQLCDILITPAVEHFGLLRFEEYAAIAEEGYRAAGAALA